MSKSNAYTKETKIKGFVDPAEIELATKIAKALIEEKKLSKKRFKELVGDVIDEENYLSVELS